MQSVGWVEVYKNIGLLRRARPENYPHLTYSIPHYLLVQYGSRRIPAIQRRSPQSLGDPLYLVCLLGPLADARLM